MDGPRLNSISRNWKADGKPLSGQHALFGAIHRQTRAAAGTRRAVELIFRAGSTASGKPLTSETVVRMDNLRSSLRAAGFYLKDSIRNFGLPGPRQWISLWCSCFHAEFLVSESSAHS